MQPHDSVSNQAIKNATGQTWEAWIALLDELGAEDLSHNEIAALLIDDGYFNPEDGWWAQTVTVGYAYAKGRRAIGQTADAGFQVGVQLIMQVEAQGLWRFITSPDGLAIWLGRGLNDFEIAKGESYQTDKGTTGEIRSVYPAEKLRLTWQPADWANPTRPRCNSIFRKRRQDGAERPPREAGRCRSTQPDECALARRPSADQGLPSIVGSQQARPFPHVQLRLAAREIVTLSTEGRADPSR